MEQKGSFLYSQEPCHLSIPGKVIAVHANVSYLRSILLS